MWENKQQQTSHCKHTTSKNGGLGGWFTEVSVGLAAVGIVVLCRLLRGFGNPPQNTDVTLWLMWKITIFSWVSDGK